MDSKDMLKRHERLGWPSLEQVGIDISLEGLQTELSITPKSVYEVAWNKSGRVENRSLVAILYFVLEDNSSSRTHALEVVSEAQEFFFGSWRSEPPKPEKGKTVDAAYWKHHFNWVDVFQAAILWGSVLGEWQFLKKVGTFPEPDSHIDSMYGIQGRDLYVAFGAFLRKSPHAELDTLLERAFAGSKKFYKLLVAVIRACVARDAALLQKTLTNFLKYYKEREFPKEYITKKISIEGTFFAHWAENEKLAITIPPEFADNIVRLN